MELVIRQITQKIVAINTDRVIAAAWLPANGKLVGGTINVHCMSHDINKSKGGMYGTNAFLLPVDDPDTAINADTVWDRQVPKDVEEASGAFDLDTVAAVAAPEFAVGEIDIAGMLGYGPNELAGAKRRKMITFANSRAAYEGTTIDTYSAVDTFVLTLPETERVKTPSLVAVGFSSPTWDETQSMHSSPAEDEWINLMFPGWTMKQALVELLGQTEAADDEPWATASQFLLNFLEPDAVLETTGSLAALPWTVFSQATLVIDVPGEPTMSLDTD